MCLYLYLVVCFVECPDVVVLWCIPIQTSVFYVYVCVFAIVPFLMKTDLQQQPALSDYLYLFISTIASISEFSVEKRSVEGETWDVRSCTIAANGRDEIEHGGRR